MLRKSYFLIFFRFFVLASSDYILDFNYVDIPTTTATSTVGETTTAEITTTRTTTSTVKRLYDTRNQFSKIEVGFEAQFEAKRREKDRVRYEKPGSDFAEASGSQMESELSDVEIIEPLQVPLVSRNDRENILSKKIAAEDLERINISFQKAFDQMFGIGTKIKPKNLKKVQRTQT